MIPMLNFYGKIFFSNAPNKNEREKHKKYTTTNSSGLIFTERGWSGAAAVERTRSRFHYEGGLQQVGFIFFNSPDILLTAHIHDFYRAQGGGAAAVVWTRS